MEVEWWQYAIVFALLIASMGIVYWLEKISPQKIEKDGWKVEYSVSPQKIVLLLVGLVGVAIVISFYQKAFTLAFALCIITAAAIALYLFSKIINEIVEKKPIIMFVIFGILACFSLYHGIKDNNTKALWGGILGILLIVFLWVLYLIENPKEPTQQPTQEPEPQQPEPNPFANLIENFAQATQQQPTQEFVERLDDFFQNYQPPLPPTPKPSRVAEYRREYQPKAYRKYRSYLSKEELGKRYERYCGYLLEKDGWEVEYSGIVRGQKDEGIDLRAYSQGRMVAAQCKFWGSGRGAVIRSKTISQFIGDLDREVSENPSLQVIGIFFAKNNNFDTGCKERLESKGFWVQIKDYDNQYPCVKCIAASGLYYVPQHRDYDNLRFSIHRGDRHCYDEAEAEKLGFREAE